MDNEFPHSGAPDEAPPAAEARNSALNAALFNRQGLRAGWRIAMYIAMVALLGLSLNFAFSKVLRSPSPGTPAPLRMFLGESLSFVIIFLPACIMARLERRPVGDYGLPFRSAFGRRFWQGCALGLAEIAVLMGCIAAFHGYSFGALHLHGPSIWKWALFWLAFFVVVGLFEEFAFRGYLQFALADGIGFWPAAWILSLLFGALHLFNKGEGPVGAAGVVSIALIFALTLKRTGNLWFVVGWHAIFDFGETYLFSVPNSGNVFEGHLSNAALHGAKWLTGGTVGPEGSVFSFFGMAVAAYFIHKVFPPRDSSLPATISTSSRDAAAQ